MSGKDIKLLLKSKMNSKKLLGDLDEPEPDIDYIEDVKFESRSAGW